MPSRRRILATGTTVLASVAGCTIPGTGTAPGGPRPDENGDETRDRDRAPTPDDTDGDDPPLGDLVVSVTTVAEGFTSPVDVSVPVPGERYVVDQVGVIHRHTDADGRPADPYLDLRDRMIDIDGFDERGLLGLAFHPSFASNGRFFVRYSAPPGPETPDGYSHTAVLSEFRVDPAAGTADEGSERVLLDIPQPQSNHNAGAITFGPDGYLYVATGDGGGAGDQGIGHPEDWYDAVAGGNGQNVTESLLGGILRIDVDDGGSGEVDDGNANEAGDDGDGDDSDDGGGRGYRIPADNPLVGTDGRDEYYAWGFRNPWRISFGPDGRLFAADVGQDAYEEVNVVEKGGNYGWNVTEASHCFRRDECPDQTPDGQALIDPVIEYSHEGAGPNGITVIGGYVYDGTAISTLRDRYVFADWQAHERLFVATERADGRWPITEVPVADPDFGEFVLSFGREPDGELLVCTSDARGADGTTGKVVRIEPA